MLDALSRPAMALDQDVKQGEQDDETGAGTRVQQQEKQDALISKAIEANTERHRASMIAPLHDNDI